jgi:hypothetical protein
MGKNNYANIIPAIENYRDPAIPYDKAYTWGAGLIETDEEGELAVVFASKLNSEASPEKIITLFNLDHLAFVDAQKQPGYRHYYADKVSELNMARSFCLWASIE